MKTIQSMQDKEGRGQRRDVRRTGSMEIQTPSDYKHRKDEARSGFAVFADAPYLKPLQIRGAHQAEASSNTSGEPSSLSLPITKITEPSACLGERCSLSSCADAGSHRFCHLTSAFPPAADNAISNDLSKRKLEILASSNPYHRSSESLLLDYYSHIKATWSKNAIDSLRKQYGLKLNKKIDRCFFSAIAAKFELNNANSVKYNFRVRQQLNQLTLADPISHSSADNLKQIKILPINDSKPRKQLHNLSLDTSHFNKNLLTSTTEKTPNFLQQELQDTQTKLSSLEKQLQLKQEQLQLTEAKLELQASMLDRANLELKQQQQQIDRKEEIIEQKSNKLNQIDRFTFLLLTHRLLEPGPPLNGTENSPAMKILGSPTTLTELRSNYKKLIASEHPDFSPYPEDEAVKRFLYLRSLYQIVYEKWERLKPTAQISDAVKQKRMNAPVPWQPETFWRNVA